MSTERALPSRRFAWLIPLVGITLISIVLLEAVLLLAQMFAPNLLHPRRAVDRAIEAVDQERFAAFAKSVSLPMIWDHRPNSSGTAMSCLGQTVAIDYDANRARVYSGYDAATSTALLIGESYTHGDEVGNDDTIAAHLFAQSGIRAANLGVGGYSPLQAVLKAKESLARFPQARIVVLGIMQENIRRSVNSYMVATNSDLGGILGIRPYVLRDTITFVPPSAYTDLAAFKQYAKTALASDFWQFAEFDFPHLVSLVDHVRSPSFRLRWGSRALKLFGRQYEWDFEDPTLRESLSTVVRHFFDWASKSGVTPAVIFFPQNKYDLNSSKSWIAHFESRYGPQKNVRAIANDGIDWARYNLKPDGSCHPSSYGYAMLAKAYAPIIGELDAKSR